MSESSKIKRGYAKKIISGSLDKAQLRDVIEKNISKDLLDSGTDVAVINDNYSHVLEFSKYLSKKIDEVVYLEEELNSICETSEMVGIKSLWDWADENDIPESCIPRNLTKLYDLEWLSLFDANLNFFDNPISILPEEISLLKNLKALELGSAVNQEYQICRLTELPKSIGNLSELASLHLQNSNLSNLPSSIGNLTHLKILKLGGNNLSTLPKEIGNLEQLKVLTLWQNNLNDIPKEIGLLTNLEGLDLNSNNLTELPSEITNLTQLKTFWYDVDNVKLSDKQKRWVSMLKDNGCEL
jgi:hypothetical protein